jgi:hypothetical protein
VKNKKLNGHDSGLKELPVIISMKSPFIKEEDFIEPKIFILHIPPLSKGVPIVFQQIIVN